MANPVNDLGSCGGKPLVDGYICRLLLLGSSPTGPRQRVHFHSRGRWARWIQQLAGRATECCSAYELHENFLPGVKNFASFRRR